MVKSSIVSISATDYYANQVDIILQRYNEMDEVGKNLLIEGLKEELRILENKNNDLKQDFQKALSIMVSVSTFIFILIGFSWTRIQVNFELPIYYLVWAFYGVLVLMTLGSLIDFVFYINPILFWTDKKKQEYETSRSFCFEDSLPHEKFETVEKSLITCYFFEIKQKAMIYMTNSIKYKKINKKLRVYMILLTIIMYMSGILAFIIY